MYKNVIHYLLCIFLVVNVLYSIRVSPTRYELFLSAGEEQEVKFVIINDRDFEQEIFISSHSWYVLKENKNIPVEEWFSYTPEKLSLKPQEEGIVLCKVKCPTDAVGFLNNVLSFTEGYKYGGMISLVISVPVYVIVKDKINFDIEISSIVFRINPVSNKTEILVGISNKSNVYIRPKGKIQIYQGKNVVYTYEFGELNPIFTEENGFIFLPYEDEKLKDGKYKVVLELKLWNLYDVKEEKVFYIKKNIWKLKN